MGRFALLWYLTVSPGNWAVVAFAALAAVGVLVEPYNYRRGTSNLRFDL